MNPVPTSNQLIGSVGCKLAGLPAVVRPLWLARWLVVASLISIHASASAVTFNFTASEQAYTLPAGASGVIIQAAGAGGAGGGADAKGTGVVGAGRGGTGGDGVTATGTYLAVSGTQLKIYVGGGGTGGVTSSFGFDATNSAGVAGSAGGVNGWTGGTGGLPGGGGYSGGGGGGGGGSVVSTSSGTRIFVAGGGGGGQGGSWESISIAPSTSNPTGGAPPGSGGLAGSSPGTNGDGGGGGGGGGGCPGGTGGSPHNDKSGTANGTAATKGGSCAIAAITSFSVLATSGGGGGAGSPADPGTGNNPRGTAGGNGLVILTPVFPMLSLAKSQPSPPLAVGNNGVYTLTVNNAGPYPANSARVLDQLPPNVTYVNSSGTGWSCSAAPNSSGMLVTCDFVGTIAATTGTSAVQITVSPTTNATVTNYASVDPTGAVSPPVPTTCTAVNVPTAGCAAPVVSGVGLTVSGRVYLDANGNNSLDGTESGTGLSGLFVKLSPSSGTVCAGPATHAVPVDATTGAFSLAKTAQGNYCLILDNNGTLTDISPSVPPDHIGTENASGIVQITISTAPEPPQNFGLYNGSRLSGVVFLDNGAGAGGVANNGARDGVEAGIGGLLIEVRNGAAVVAFATTGGNGRYSMLVPTSIGQQRLVTPVAPSGYLATGGTPGTSGGSYNRPSLSYTPVNGIDLIDANFGLVPANTLSPNGAGMGQPGTVVFYAHTFTAGSEGQVAFSLANAATPAGLPWSQVLYRDSDCSSTLEGSEPQISVPITVTAGQTLCLIVKQFIPAAAATGAKNTITLSAAFSYTHSAPLLASAFTVNDITTVGLQGALALNKLVSNITLGSPVATTVVASPGNVLEYSLKAQNNGSEPLTTLVINDATPAFTTYLSAACPGALPAGVSACSVSSQPATGAQGNLQWTFTGSLLPSAQLLVTYQVKVNQ